MIYSAGIVIIRANVEYLMLRHRSNWDFPKGKLEEGEKFIEAALRETEEEAGVSDLSFDWSYIYHQTQPYAKKPKIARYYLARLQSGEPIIRPNADTGLCEHEEVKWFNYNEASSLQLIPRIREVLDWAHSIVET